MDWRRKTPDLGVFFKTQSNNGSALKIFKFIGKCYTSLETGFRINLVIDRDPMKGQGAVNFEDIDRRLKKNWPPEYAERRRDRIKESNVPRLPVSRAAYARFGKERGKRIGQAADRIRRNAHIRGLEYTLTPERAVELITSPCAYCGCTYPLPKTIGIDRIDNSKGYVEGNVNPCCRRCNAAKNDLTLEEFKTLVRMIYEHLCFEPY